MYRKIASEILKGKGNNLKNILELSCKIARTLNFENLQNKELRTEDTAKIASEIAVFPSLREILNLKQLEFVNKSNEQFGGCILDGRDIGTVVFPSAELKLWITANLDIRAARRYKEYLEGGHEVSLEDVIENVKSRAFNDSNRKESPLVKAEDAINIVDSSFSFPMIFCFCA